MEGILLPVFVVIGVYFLLGLAIALVAYTDARRTNDTSRWHAGEWAQAIVLGPLVILMLILQRIIPDPPQRPR